MRNLRGLVKFAENSKAFETLRDTFSPKNGFRLDASPQNEYNYQNAGGTNNSYRSFLELARKNGFGYHSAHVNDYGERYGVDEAVKLLDDVARERSKQKQVKDTEESLDDYLVTSTRDYIPQIADLDGIVPTIPQDLGSNAKRYFSRYRDPTAPKIVDPYFFARMRSDTKGILGMSTSGGPYESLPAGISGLDEAALAALSLHGFFDDSKLPSVYKIGRDDQKTIAKSVGVGLGLPLEYLPFMHGRAFYFPPLNKVYLPSTAEIKTILHEMGHGKARINNRNAVGYKPYDAKFDPKNLWRHPTILEEHGNADTLYAAGLLGDDSGSWYYRNMLRNWYADQLHKQFGTKPVPFKNEEELVNHGDEVMIPGNTPRFLGR